MTTRLMVYREAPSVCQVSDLRETSWASSLNWGADVSVSWGVWAQRVAAWYDLPPLPGQARQETPRLRRARSGDGLMADS
jgi:hypothetical protein